MLLVSLKSVLCFISWVKINTINKKYHIKWRWWVIYTLKGEWNFPFYVQGNICDYFVCAVTQKDVNQGILQPWVLIYWHFSVCVLYPLRNSVCTVYISHFPKFSVLWNKLMDGSPLQEFYPQLSTKARDLWIFTSMSSSFSCRFLNKMLHCTSFAFFQVMYHPSACLPSLSHSLFHLGKSFAWPSQQWTLPENKSHKKH